MSLNYGGLNPNHITKKANGNQDFQKRPGLKVVIGLTAEYVYKSLFHAASGD